MAIRKVQDSFQVRDDTPGMCRARTAPLQVARLAVYLITSELPVIRPESMPSAEITSYKPTYQDFKEPYSFA